ncbi:BEL1-like homeodomain protein 9 [Quillaja saponaria]|uniref:BEL1-like homeodomain protein 9 n=1 Tax=Quillaja saponaria TaxID=32244 RepID=A0AAD7L453_QUISA|nr:BEL1-like homeodomain protein 9 [Quillaja saponaria]
MAEEGFEPYHVPQQSRRDKLRILAQNHQTGLVESSDNLQGCAGRLGFFPFYDHSLISSNLLTFSDAATHELHIQNTPFYGTSEACKGNPGGVEKEEGSNLMGFVGGVINGSSSSFSVSHHAYLDRELSLPINPGAIQDINNQFLYHSPNLREFDQSYNGGEVVVFKPEPLSLSLSSHNAHHHQTSNLPLELNLQRYGSSIYGDKVVSGCEYIIPSTVDGSGSASNNVSKSSGPLGPFTGYASILKGSRFLKPAQQLLEEVCVAGGRGICAEKVTADPTLIESPSESLSASENADERLGCGDGGEARKKKSRLLTMLDEVYRRYRQYYQQLQAVVTSFEYVSGLGNATPYADLARNAMSKHFRCLKNAITDQLQFTNKAQVHISHRKDDSVRFGTTDKDLYSQRSVHSSGFLDHQPVWRPQRGLPERAVSVLRAWLFEHFLHPYPTDTDKLMLAKQTGLSRSQVSNWFINARVRLWKPMVEEIHTLETRQAQNNSPREEHNISRSGDHLPSANSLVSENPSTSTIRVQDAPCKRTRNELSDIHVRSQDPLNLPYNNFSSNQPQGVDMSMGGGSSGVSLTLGLQQNHGIGLSEPFPISAAQRFGLAVEPSNAGYAMDSFESQSRHFGRNFVGGQLLHDFVG